MHSQKLQKVGFAMISGFLQFLTASIGTSKAKGKEGKKSHYCQYKGLYIHSILFLVTRVP